MLSKILKRFLSIVLTLSLMFSMVPTMDMFSGSSVASATEHTTTDEPATEDHSEQNEQPDDYQPIDQSSGFIDIVPFDVSYSVVFSGNGHTSGSPPNPIYGSYIYRTGFINTVILPGANTMVKEDHVFRGWSRSSSGGVVFAPGARYEVNPSTNMLYAIWRAIDDDTEDPNPPVVTYLISYDSNVAKSDVVVNMPGDQIKTHGFALMLGTEKPAMRGNIFLGWSTNPRDKVATYRPGSIFLEDGDTTLYAIWRIYIKNPASGYKTLPVRKCSDPVDLINGSLDWEYTDLQLEGAKPLTFTREYNSIFTDDDHGLGYGWTHSF